jgi:nucleoside-diphosphate-sugar epimerase
MGFNNKLLIVGGTGFIGSYLTNEALSRGFEVTILALNNKKVNPNSINVDFLFGDFECLPGLFLG